MRVPFSEVFRIEKTDDGYALAVRRPIVLRPYWSMRLEAEINRVANPAVLSGRYLEVEESPTGEWEIEGFAATEAR
ncbi:MAG TPA: hypothetical protein VGD27_13615 [Longimicrobiales bacterium]